MLPMDVGVRIEATEAVRLLLEISESLDYNELHAAYDRMPCQTKAPLKQMLQLVIIGFMELKRFESTITVNECSNCLQCPMPTKNQCTYTV